MEKVTYLSSSMVFESTTWWPSKEGDERQSPPPLSSYGFQKLSVEYFAHAAWDQHQLPYTIVRPFNCVGVGDGRALGDVEVMSGNVKLAMSHVVPDLVQKALRGQDPLHILGDGTQVRHYTYGGDLARGIVKAMEHPVARNEDAFDRVHFGDAPVLPARGRRRRAGARHHGAGRPLRGQLLEHGAPALAGPVRLPLPDGLGHHLDRGPRRRPLLWPTDDHDARLRHERSADLGDGLRVRVGSHRGSA
jgi:nucleoside-diphosphate-sugar epimerase